MGQFIQVIDVVSHISAALSTPALTLGLVYFAWRQHKLEHERHLLSLTDKRWAVLVGMVRLAGYLHAVSDGARLDVNAVSTQVKESCSLIEAAPYLFKPPEVAYLFDFAQKAYELETLSIKSQGERTPEINTLLTWFDKQGPVVSKTLDEYVNFYVV